MRQLGFDGKPLARPFAAFRDYAFNEWKDHYEMSPSWDAKEFKALKRLHDACGEQSFPIWDIFLNSRGEYFNGHNPTKCYSERDRLRVQIVPEPDKPKNPWTDEERRKIRKRHEERKRLRQQYEREAEARRREILARDSQGPTITKGMIDELRATLKRG